MRKKFRLKIAFIIVIISFAAVLNAATASAGVTVTANAAISGKVMVLGASDAIEGAIISLNGVTQSAAVTGPDGKYRFELATGTADVRCTAYGFQERAFHTVVEPGNEYEMNVYLDRVDFISDAVVVRAKKDKNEVIKTTIERAQLKKIPGTAGDALRAVQSMPGVAVMSDYSSGLAVQGGGPGDNMYLLDGIPWPYPFHFGGLLSTVYSGLLSSVDLNTAGFGAQWGNIMGAVLDAKTRPGAKDRFRGDIDISIITSQALFEAPIGLGDASVAVYGRRSYIDLIIGQAMKTEGFTAFPFFWDIGGSLDFTLGKDNHFKAIALATDDMLKMYVDPAENTASSYTGDFSMDNGAFTGGASWSNTSLSGLTSKLTAYYYNLFEKSVIGKDFNINLGQSDFGLKEELEWDAGSFMGVGHAIGFGADVQRIHDEAVVNLAFDIIHHTADPTSTKVDGWHTNRGGYLQDRMRLLPGLDLTAGIRYDKNDKVGRDTTLPRISLSWQSDEKTLWKAAWGIYSQFPTDVQ